MRKLCFCDAISTLLVLHWFTAHYKKENLKARIGQNNHWHITSEASTIRRDCFVKTNPKHISQYVDNSLFRQIFHHLQPVFHIDQLLVADLLNCVYPVLSVREIVHGFVIDNMDNYPIMGKNTFFHTVCFSPFIFFYYLCNQISIHKRNGNYKDNTDTD